MDVGPSQGKVETIFMKFVIGGDEFLEDGQMVRVQMTRKKASKAKVWNAQIVMLKYDTRPREPPRKRGKKRQRKSGSKIVSERKSSKIT